MSAQVTYVSALSVYVSAARSVNVTFPTPRGMWMMDYNHWGVDLSGNQFNAEMGSDVIQVSDCPFDYPNAGESRCLSESHKLG